jgi:hypothetical protein
MKFNHNSGKSNIKYFTNAKRKKKPLSNSTPDNDHNLALKLQSEEYDKLTGSYSINETRLLNDRLYTGNYNKKRNHSTYSGPVSSNTQISQSSSHIFSPNQYNDLLSSSSSSASSSSSSNLNSMYSRDLTANDYEMLLQLQDVKPKQNGASNLDLSMLPSYKFKSCLPNKKTTNKNPKTIVLDHRIIIDLVDSDKETTPEPKERKVECSICLQNYQDGEEVVTLPCLHKFHQDCIFPWLKINCNCPIDKIIVEFNR